MEKKQKCARYVRIGCGVPSIKIQFLYLHIKLFHIEETPAQNNTNINDAPTLGNEIPDQVINEDDEFVLILNENTYDRKIQLA